MNPTPPSPFGPLTLEPYPPTPHPQVSCGYRPPLDESWPAELLQLVRDCWAQDPADRPNMQVGCSNDTYSLPKSLACLVPASLTHPPPHPPTHPPRTHTRGMKSGSDAPPALTHACLPYSPLPPPPTHTWHDVMCRLWCTACASWTCLPWRSWRSSRWQRGTATGTATLRGTGAGGGIRSTGEVGRGGMLNCRMLAAAHACSAEGGQHAQHHCWRYCHSSAGRVCAAMAVAPAVGGRGSCLLRCSHSLS